MFLRSEVGVESMTIDGFDILRCIIGVTIPMVCFFVRLGSDALYHLDGLECLIHIYT